MFKLAWRTLTTGLSSIWYGRFTKYVSIINVSLWFHLNNITNRYQNCELTGKRVARKIIMCKFQSHWSSSLYVRIKILKSLVWVYCAPHAEPLHFFLLDFRLMKNTKDPYETILIRICPISSSLITHLNFTFFGNGVFSLPSLFRILAEGTSQIG